MEELLADLGDYFTPDQKRAIGAHSARVVAEAVKGLPDRLRAVVASCEARTEYDRGIRDGVILAAALLDLLARGPNR